MMSPISQTSQNMANENNHFSYTFQIIMQQLFILENKHVTKTEKKVKSFNEISGVKGIGDMTSILKSMESLKEMQECLI